MTSRQRVEMTFRHQEPDRVPVFEQTICCRIAADIMGRRMRTGGGRLRWEETAARWESEQAWQDYVGRVLEDVGDLVRVLDHDIVHVPWRHSERPSQKLDDCTFRCEDRANGIWTIYHYDKATDVFDQVDSAVAREGLPAIERLVASWERGLDSLQLPPPEHYDDLLQIARRAGGDRYLVAGDGMVMIPPQAPWLEACATRPDLIERCLDLAVAWAEVAIPVLAKIGVGCLWAGGDLASSAGPLYSPAMFRRFILPRLQRITRAAHRSGLVYLFRTDGDIWPLSQQLLVDSAVDGYGEIDNDAGMDPADVKRKLPHLTLWGGISCGRLLTFGTPDEIRAEVKRVMDACAPGGGFIFGSSNSIHQGIPTRNFLAMHDAAREYERRPR